MFYLITFLVLSLDVLIKRAVVISFTQFQTFPLIKDFLHITYVQNTGVAFGLFQQQRLYLTVVGIIICCLVIYYYLKEGSKALLSSVYLALILGGSLGNLFDRIAYGYVVDYIDFRFFPVFNLADIAINVGVALIVYDLMTRSKNASRSS